MRLVFPIFCLLSKLQTGHDEGGHNLLELLLLQAKASNSHKQEYHGLEL